LYERPANRFVATFVGSPAMNMLRGRLTKANETYCFVAGGMTLTLPADKAAKVQSYTNKDIELGIRPEHMLDRSTHTQADNVVRGTVLLIELMGNEIIVHVDVAGQTVIGRLDAHAPVAHGVEHDFMFDMRYSHFFDPASGNNVSC
jgi:multiple sugar transport system ATP-binding protein